MIQSSYFNGKLVKVKNFPKGTAVAFHRTNHSVMLGLITNEGIVQWWEVKKTQWDRLVRSKQWCNIPADPQGECKLQLRVLAAKEGNALVGVVGEDKLLRYWPFTKEEWAEVSEFLSVREAVK